MPRTPAMKLAMPQYNPDVEYSLDLGAEATPQPEDTPQPADDTAPAPPRRRSWRSSSHDTEKTRHSNAYDAAGNLKIAARGRQEAQRDCGICEEVAVEPVRTLCCGALFCKEHIDDWIYGPAATGLCPTCTAPCVLPPSMDTEKEAARPRTPPSSRSHSPSHASAPPQAPLVPGKDSIVRVLSVLALLLLLGVLFVGRGERLSEFLSSS
ncbi:hypothetical protein B0H17DRAFT_1187276 [Mycena rosella]|uniref:RING-type domain-containing protein n=1 Tax=Mycena rosella TaxID=1033263 RepID=A0AAD7FU04_MYCRO|nr:hypothetical protein B0H17DRAFT_1187276 [Mycena rosella]